nr:MAG TPA: hypothetical protein [Caudoviricetes sp.]
MKRKGYYEYDPVIYPRMLCVAIGLNQEDANKCFEGRKGEVLKVDFSNYDAATYDEVREKSNKKLCSFINFASKDSMRMPSVCSMAASLLPI